MQSAAGTVVLTMLFFALYYLFLWQAVDLRLIYHGGGSVLNFPVFYKGLEFFHQTVFWPGGLVVYISAFFAQFFSIGWAGPLIAAFQAWLLWLAIGAIIRIACGRQLRLISFVAPILLLILYAGYIYPFGIAMGLLAALGFVYLYMRLTSKKRATDLPLFLVLSIILFLIGGGAYLVFALVCGIYELFLRRRPVPGIAFLVLAPIVAYVISAVVFEASVIDVLNGFWPRDIINIFRIAAAYGLYLLLPLTLLGLWFSETLKKSIAGSITVWFAKKEIVLPSPLVAIVAGAIIGVLSLNWWLKTQIGVTYFSCNGMWRQILETAVEYPGNALINHAANRALYYTGGLTQNMFAYSQRLDALMLPKEAWNLLGMWRLFDTYLELGQMNQADSALFQCVEMYGEQPVFLKRLALINMAKGDIGSAKVYLGALNKTLFDAGWAKGWLEKIELDPNLSSDEEIQRFRSIIPTINRDFNIRDDTVFLDLLDRNRHNRMAFEYLEAFYLLSNQHDKFVENLGRLNDFDYIGIPRIYEEAILLYSYTKKTKVEIPGREISAESRERFSNFLKVLAGKYGGDKKAAFYELARDFGDSYFFYSIYGLSGMKQ